MEKLTNLLLSHCPNIQFPNNNNNYRDENTDNNNDDHDDKTNPRANNSPDTRI